MLLVNYVNIVNQTQTGIDQMLKKLFTAAVFIGMTATANAGIITTAWQGDVVVEQPMNFVDQSVSFAQFDSSLGMLQSIELIFSGTQHAVGSLTNTATAGILQEWINTAHIFLDFEEVEIAKIEVSADLNVPRAGIAFTAGQVLDVDLAANDSKNFSFTFSDDIFSEFIGTGTIGFDVGTFARTSVTRDGGNYDESLTTLASADVQVRYVYAVEDPTPVSEPGTLAIFGLALAGFGLRARNKKSVK